MQQLIIKGRLPGLNEIIAMSKKGKRGYQPYQIAKKEINHMIMIVLVVIFVRIITFISIRIIVTTVCMDIIIIINLIYYASSPNQ